MHRVDPEHRPEFEIAAPSAAIGDERTLVLASGDTFVVTDRHGEMRAGPASRHGLYAGGTRFLSGLWLHVAGNRPLLLSSGIREDEGGLFVHESNPDVLDQPSSCLERDRVHLARRMIISDGTCELSISLRNFADGPIRLPLRLWFTADYADVFEVRGSRRPRRGRMLATAIAKDAIDLGYVGLDGVTRTTRLELDPAPARAGARSADWVAALESGERMQIAARIGCALSPVATGFRLPEKGGWCAHEPTRFQPSGVRVRGRCIHGAGCGGASTANVCATQHGPCQWIGGKSHRHLSHDDACAGRGVKSGLLPG